MANININDGLEKITINGDENRAFYFCPTDFSLPARLREAFNDIQEELSKYKNFAEVTSDERIDIFEKLGNLIREKLDKVFNAPVSDAIFGRVSPLTIISGKMYFEYMFDALMPIIEDRLAVSMEAFSKHTAKYVKE